MLGCELRSCTDEKMKFGAALTSARHKEVELHRLNLYLSFTAEEWCRAKLQVVPYNQIFLTFPNPPVISLFSLANIPDVGFHDTLTKEWLQQCTKGEKYEILTNVWIQTCRGLNSS